MAVTIARQNILTVTFTFIESNLRSKGFSEIHIGEFAGVLPDVQSANFGTFISEMIDNMEGFVDCRVTDVSANYHWSVSANALFGDSPNVERKGVFQFDTAAGFPAIVTVPGLDFDALEADGINIRRTGTVFEGSLAAALQGFHDKLQNGVTIGVVTFPTTDRRGSDYNGLIDAYQQHRRSSRG